MGIRPGRSVRNMKKVAWTRYSRSRPRKSYIKAMPHQTLQQFRMGIAKDDYDLTINLRAEDDVIIRDNTIESARQTANKLLEKSIPSSYYLVVRIFPHHVLRENKMIAGAGADRLQKGMRQSFGRPTHKAARIYAGKALFTIRTYKQHEGLIRTAFGRAKRKLSGNFKIIQVEDTIAV